VRNRAATREGGGGGGDEGGGGSSGEGGGEGSESGGGGGSGEGDGGGGGGGGEEGGGWWGGFRPKNLLGALRGSVPLLCNHVSATVVDGAGATNAPGCAVHPPQRPTHDRHTAPPALSGTDAAGVFRSHHNQVLTSP
jgi:hypothetical protein